ISSCRCKTKARGSITFWGVATEFFQHEWEFLNPVPKKVYHDMTMENYSDLVSLGHSISRPDIIMLLKEEKEPWMVVRKNKKLEYGFSFNL
uniref:KRAB domain-containing protein n=1 Tax=Moschus moschiferus TaxID=68415 RepID=A0A8C6EAV2_MOSMO